MVHKIKYDTNKERELWVNNDESLYTWWKSSGMSMTDFIREFKEDIDKIIIEKGG